jgi:signal transduction histidine kinase
MLLVLFLFGFPGDLPAQPETERRKEVLILHSYHPGLPWTDGVMAGMQEVLDLPPETIHYHVEYLDTMRHPDPEYFAHVLDAILHYKLEKRFFDLVMVSDNEALNFVLEHRQALFADTPVVFCGISGLTEELGRSIPMLTGVLEQPDYRGLLRQALDLNPRAREFIVIGSTRDISGRLDREAFQAAAKEFSVRTYFTYWDDLPAAELDTRLRKLQPGHVVIVNGLITDGRGQPLPLQEQERLFREACPVPLFSHQETLLGRGSIGGPVISARRQGHLTAELALRILKGEVSADLPPQIPSSYPPAFDYQRLNAFRLPLEVLPDGHRLINQPLSFYRLTHRQAGILVAVLGGSLTVTLLLTSNTLKRKKAEARLRESEQNYKQLSQQFQIILEGIPDGLTLISKDMKVIWSNQGTGSYFNRMLGSIPGEYCCKMLYNRAELCKNCPAIQAFASGRNEEATITTPDGQILEVKAFPVLDGTGEILNVIMHATDITEKTRLREEALRNSRLASLGELAAGVAHEINNPNGLILFNSDLVRAGWQAAEPILEAHYQSHGDFPLGGLTYSEMRTEIPQLLNEMVEGAQRIRRIVDDLKDFVRRDGPDLKARVDLNEVARTAARLIKNPIKKSTDHFEFVCAEPLPYFIGSFQRIEQVAVNLIMNACQALPGRDRGIRVETRFDESANRLQLLVSDQGVGIAARDLPHISEPFFTTKREHGGTGLGLSVVARIVAEHRGTLEFQSTPGVGTTAVLSLPAFSEGEIHD